MEINWLRVVACVLGKVAIRAGTMIAVYLLLLCLYNMLLLKSGIVQIETFDTAEDLAGVDAFLRKQNILRQRFQGVIESYGKQSLRSEERQQQVLRLGGVYE